jgi:hypothetical protein
LERSAEQKIRGDNTQARAAFEAPRSALLVIPIVWRSLSKYGMVCGVKMTRGELR